MKKIIFILITLIIALSLFGCAQENNQEANTISDETTTPNLQESPIVDEPTNTSNLPNSLSESTCHLISGSKLGELFNLTYDKFSGDSFPKSNYANCSYQFKELIADQFAKKIELYIYAEDNSEEALEKYTSRRQTDLYEDITNQFSGNANIVDITLEGITSKIIAVKGKYKIELTIPKSSTSNEDLKLHKPGLIEAMKIILSNLN
ncbi:MAG: hypothetical protein HON47_02870 [Candidatus Diapherotrites archaeon]|jgi:hypothetical protein|uniref:Uncharacterized protein n=1 Tax=Candidatus Iainarchaeum sp. TaxID=3101447 RepID=A0A8T5GF89_9ARCH|nr:hypothetical protein [Candidatus Diapherotrites archaeon]MBT7367132.1 hypothetical protein [Candidatus Woesearchaeota archaeon]